MLNRRYLEARKNHLLMENAAKSAALAYLPPCAESLIAASAARRPEALRFFMASAMRGNPMVIGHAAFSRRTLPHICTTELPPEPRRRRPPPIPMSDGELAYLRNRARTLGW
jgi:hypothetical protein